MAEAKVVLHLSGPEAEALKQLLGNMTHDSSRGSHDLMVIMKQSSQEERRLLRDVYSCLRRLGESEFGAS